MQKICFIAVLALVVAQLPALEQGAPISKDKAGLALDGYDVVAYFVDTKNKKGSPEWSSRYRDATWYFASKEHKMLFDQEPEKYMPEFGGYCVYAVSKNGFAEGAGKYGQVEDGKLYFNTNFFTYKRYNSNPPDYNEKAHKNWPEVKKSIVSK